MLFDAHADILTDMYAENTKKKSNNSFKEKHYDKYKKADVLGSIFVNYTHPDGDNSKVFDEIFDVAIEEIEHNQDIFSVCLNSKDIYEAYDEGKMGIIIGVEGMKFLKGIDHLRELYNKGLRHGILTWNEVNEYGSGVSSEKGGLTKKGIELIKEMEHLGMIIDLAHANENTYYDILSNISKPVILSHGNCKALCNHRRNYTDEQLIALKNKGGVLGLTDVGIFLSEDEEFRTVQKMAEHIDYAVKLIGIDHVGLGLDVCYYLYSGKTNTHVKGFEDIDKIDNLYDCLKKLGYSKDDIDKIAYKNFMRIVKTILG